MVTKLEMNCTKLTLTMSDVMRNIDFGVIVVVWADSKSRRAGGVGRWAH